MKLEIKHLAPYLPYRLKVLTPTAYNFYGVHTDTPILIIDGVANKDMLKFEGMGGFYPIADFTPLLKPLTLLTKEIEVNGEKFVPLNRLNGECFGLTKYNIFIREDNTIALLGNFNEGYNVLTTTAKDKLFEWHFDVFGLIPQGLAIDINTLK